MVWNLICAQKWQTWLTLTGLNIQGCQAKLSVVKVIVLSNQNSTDVRVHGVLIELVDVDRHLTEMLVHGGTSADSDTKLAKLIAESIHADNMHLLYLFVILFEVAGSERRRRVDLIDLKLHLELLLGQCCDFGPRLRVSVTKEPIGLARLINIIQTSLEHGLVFEIEESVTEHNCIIFIENLAHTARFTVLVHLSRSGE